MNFNKVYPAAPEQMWSYKEKKSPPPCNECNQKCITIFARVFYKKDVENYCTVECWNKHFYPNHQKEFV